MTKFSAPFATNHRGASVEIDGDHFAHLDVHVGVLSKDVAQVECDVGWRQRRGGNLVQQRLELLIVVPVDQRDVHIA